MDGTSSGTATPVHARTCTPLTAVVTFPTGFVAAGLNGCLLVFERETSSILNDGAHRLPEVDLVVCVIVCSVCAGGRMGGCAGGSCFSHVCCGVWLKRRAVRRADKPTYLLLRSLRITMLDAIVNVRGLSISSSHDTIGLAVDGGIGVLSLLYIASLAEDVTQPNVSDFTPACCRESDLTPSSRVGDCVLCPSCRRVPNDTR